MKSTSISSDVNPDLDLATLLEYNVSNFPRLVIRKRWQDINKKQRQRGRRKYLGLLHQNLQDDAGSDDLVLVLPLSHTTKFGTNRDLHYEAMELKAEHLRQSAQNRTELLGESAATLFMEEYQNGECKLLKGYRSGGAGIDQLWVNHSKQIYYVVESKGPNAKLTNNPFAIRGAKNGGGLKQMSDRWVANRLTRLKARHLELYNQIKNDCGLTEDDDALVRDPKKKNATHRIKGLVIMASWDEETGNVIPVVTDKFKYNF